MPWKPEKGFIGKVVEDKILPKLFDVLEGLMDKTKDGTFYNIYNLVIFGKINSKIYVCTLDNGKFCLNNDEDSLKCLYLTLLSFTLTGKGLPSFLKVRFRLPSPIRDGSVFKNASQTISTVIIGDKIFFRDYNTGEDVNIKYDLLDS